ncbi:MAG: hypothetical protein HGA86_06070, partial [Anaerolineaceae bacterium]|nr:hypothetical protein [Anaerolineaceae bacterium]
MFKKTPLYPFFLVIYFVLALLAANLTEVTLDASVRPLFAALILAGLLYALFSLITHQRHKTALLSAFVLLLFFSYGHVYQFLKDTPILGFNLGRHTLLAAVYAVLLVVGLLLLRCAKPAAQATAALNLLTAALLAFSLFQFVRFATLPSAAPTTETNPSADSTQTQQKPAAGQTLPDIYYIIPDMYARHDAILNDTGYDNSAFLQQLRDLGFIVTNCSRSNYAQTALSISSSLNMDYLSALGIVDENGAAAATRDNRVSAALEKLGYTVYGLESGFRLDELAQNTTSLAPTQASLFLRAILPFESWFIRSTALRIFIDVRNPLITPFVDRLMFPFHEHADRQLFILDQLAKMPALPGPKFVFVHIMLPHPPYIFAADGTLITDALYYREGWGLPSTDELFRKGYANQAEFISSRLPEILRTIQQDSTTPPVIIV